MKSSERIDEIYVSMRIELEGVRLDHAIIQYLDEEYERNKPCEHSDIPKVGGSCTKCGFSLSFTKQHCCVCARACGHTTPTSYCELHRLIR